MYEIDFVRAFCAIGIVIYHFSGKINEKTFFPFYNFKNGYWGRVLVTCFFIMSGMMLYYHNSKIENYKDFFIKRIKSIYPSFYLTYIPFFLINIYLKKSVFWGGNPLKLILSFLGLDGYLYYISPNYYIIGEWFLGAIILLYILYPAVLYLVNKGQWIFPVLLMALYIWQTSFASIFAIDSYHNIISCLVSFVLGMYIMKYSLLDRKPIVIISFVLFILLVIINVPFLQMYLEKITGVSLFFVLAFLGKLIIKKDVLKRIIIFTSGISYELFLVHHVIIIFVVDMLNPTGISIVLCMLLVLSVTILGAYVVNKVSKLLIKGIIVRRNS